MKEHHKIHLAPFMWERADYYYRTHLTKIKTAMIMYGYSEPPDSDIAAHPAKWEGKHWNWFVRG